MLESGLWRFVRIVAIISLNVNMEQEVRMSFDWH